VGMNERPEMRKRGAGHAQPDVVARDVPLEGRRPLLPELREVEVGRTIESVGSHAHGYEARDAIDAHARASPRDEVPGARLEDEPERIERSTHDLRAFAIASGDAAPPPDRRRERREMRRLVGAAKPALRIEMEETRRALCALLQLGR